MRKKVGLALGGGSTRGLAHLGVIGVLEDAGISIDLVAGTSLGSIIGAVYCAGYSSTKAIQVAAHMGWWKIAALTWPSGGFFSLNPLERFLVRQLGNISFSDLKIPLAVVATDIDTGKEVILCEGPLAPAVRASSSIPGIIVPARLNGRRLVDGALANTVPVSVVRRMGADYVIAVDILPHSVRKFWGPFGVGFAALEILIQNAGGGLQQADCLIRPDLAGSSYWRFSRWKYLYELGRKQALEILPQIKTALR
jgi:NTE family protein